MFGEGAGANIACRFAIEQPSRVHGLVLVHPTGTTAGFMEMMKDKLNNWKLIHKGMNPDAEAYLIWHRFGRVGLQFTTWSTISSFSFSFFPLGCSEGEELMEISLTFSFESSLEIRSEWNIVFHL